MVGTSGNDTINAVLDIGTTPSSTTLQIADVIDGGAGTDTMNVTLATTTSTIPAATIKNVEVFNIRNVASTAGENFANITGETKIVSAGSQAALVLTGVGSGTTLGVSDTAQNLTLLLRPQCGEMIPDMRLDQFGQLCFLIAKRGQFYLQCYQSFESL